MSIELRNADSLPTPQGYSHASIAPPGSIVHLAGQIGTDADGNMPDGLTAQTANALRNLATALEAAGGTLDDLAKITILVVGWTEPMGADLFAGMAAAGETHSFPTVPATLVGVQSLYIDAALVEIEGVAVLAG